MTAHLKVRWADPEYRARVVTAVKASFGTPEARAAKGAESKARWADPNYRARTSAAIKIALNEREYLATRSDASKTMWADPTHRAKIRSSMRAYWLRVWKEEAEEEAQIEAQIEALRKLKDDPDALAAVEASLLKELSCSSPHRGIRVIPCRANSSSRA